MTQVEVAFAASEKEAGELDDEIETAIDELWLPGSPVKVVELHAAVAHQARALMRSELAAGRSGLSASDAIHLATAVTMGADDCHTYDQRLARHAAGVPFPVREPFTPQGQLPGT
ncbi:MAG: PIN domain-containing protein [Solirubrobacteraceae bacterium]